MTCVSHIHRFVLTGNFQKPLLLFNRVCIVEPACRDGENDEVVVKAVGGSISMKRVCHELRRPSPKLVFPRTKEKPSSDKTSSSVLSPFESQRVETPTATT